MKKIVAFLEKYPLALAAVVALLAAFTGFGAFVCFRMFELYKPSEILNEHLATFALPIGIMFLYFFIRCMVSLGTVVMDLIQDKLGFKNRKNGRR